MLDGCFFTKRTFADTPFIELLFVRMQRLLNQKSLARYLGVTARTVRRWKEDDIGPPSARLHINKRRVYYRLESVIDWLESLTDEGLKSLALGVETPVPGRPLPTTQSRHPEPFV